DKGDRGDPGASADQAPIFKLLVDRGARARYAFDAFSASTPRTTPDSSGNSNGLTLSTDGVNRIENQPGDSAIQFLGNGHGTAADAASLNPYREISLAARVRLSTEAPSDTQTLISKPNQYELAVIGGTLRARFKTVLSDWVWIGAGSVPGGQWVDVRATYDGKALRTFVNGKQTYYAPSAAGPLVSGDDPLYVGARRANVHGFKGFLDNVEILAYAVQSQDSLAMLPGKATRGQLSLDSIPGLQAALDAKANLNGAVFTGRIRTGTDSAARAAIMKIDGNGNANIELRSHGAYPYIDFATNQAADYNSRIILGADSVLSLISNKSIAVSPGLDVSGPIRRQGKTVLDRGNTLVVSKLFEPSPYWTPSTTGMQEVKGFSANIDVPVPGTIIVHLNALVGHQGDGAAIYIGPAIDGNISSGNHGGYRTNAAGTPRFFGTAAVNSRHVEAGSHTVQAMANVDVSPKADIAWGNLLVQFIPD
ncbi:MAG TPA: LamG domain-containing protein, partial [Fibrobacteria bacterium]|nr:LamG domain-containing protein [Fibrobacteria bacterium]